MSNSLVQKYNQINEKITFFSKNNKSTAHGCNIHQHRSTHPYVQPLKPPQIKMNMLCSSKNILYRKCSKKSGRCVKIFLIFLEPPQQPPPYKYLHWVRLPTNNTLAYFQNDQTNYFQYYWVLFRIYMEWLSEWVTKVFLGRTVGPTKREYQR